VKDCTLGLLTTTVTTEEVLVFYTTEVNKILKSIFITNNDSAASTFSIILRNTIKGDFYISNECSIDANEIVVINLYLTIRPEESIYVLSPGSITFIAIGDE
jgi:hypothetical protein